MIRVKYIPALDNNYIWIIQNNQGDLHKDKFIAVDPGDAKPILKYLKLQQLTLEAIFITHHHHDHVGGVAELLKIYPEISIFGLQNSPAQEITQSLNEGDKIDVLGISFSIMALPGHTLDHIAYFTPGHLFCGDVLFSGGCGRIFEGTHQQMFDSLQKINSLEDDTKIYPTHEYTLSNLKFAQEVEPDNKAISEYYSQCERKLSNGEITLPSKLTTERKINPFLRTQVPGVINQVKSRISKADSASVFIALREWKDGF